MDIQFRAAGCVGCEGQAAEGRREDQNQGTERRGERFRERNRRAAAAATERAGLGARASRAGFAKANAGEPRRSPRPAQPARASEAEASGDRGRGRTRMPTRCTTVTERQPAVSAASRRARDAQPAKRAEA